MTSHRDIRDLVDEESSRWTPADDRDADEVQGILSDSLLLGPVRLSEEVQTLFFAAAPSEAPSKDRVLARLFGATMQRKREDIHLSIDQVSEQMETEAALLSRIEGGRSNPSVLPAKRLAIWAKLLGVRTEAIRPALLVALEYVGRTRSEEGAVFARRSGRSDRGGALSRTEAFEYLEKLESALRDD